MNREQQAQLEAALAARERHEPIQATDPEVLALLEIADRLEQWTPPAPSAAFVDRLDAMLQRTPAPIPPQRQALRVVAWWQWFVQRWSQPQFAGLIAIGLVLVLVVGYGARGWLAGPVDPPPLIDLNSQQAMARADDLLAAITAHSGTPVPAAEQSQLVRDYHSTVAKVLASLPRSEAQRWAEDQRRKVNELRGVLDDRTVDALLEALTTANLPSVTATLRAAPPATPQLQRTPTRLPATATRIPNASTVSPSAPTILPDQPAPTFAPLPSPTRLEAPASPLPTAAEETRPDPTRVRPSTVPNELPTPTSEPSAEPTAEPLPSATPEEPTPEPTPEIGDLPTPKPTDGVDPTPLPTAGTRATPTATNTPIDLATPLPTQGTRATPTLPFPTVEPPTPEPSATEEATEVPTEVATEAPTEAPTNPPPTEAPTEPPEPSATALPR